MVQEKVCKGFFVCYLCKEQVGYSRMLTTLSGFVVSVCDKCFEGYSGGD